MSETGSVPPSDLDVNTDELFTVLSDSRRRCVLSYLESRDDEVAELPELVDRMMAREDGRESDERDTVATALHHTHLPKLAEAGLLDYDPRSETVRYYGHTDCERAVALAVETTGGRS